MAKARPATQPAGLWDEIGRLEQEIQGLQVADPGAQQVVDLLERHAQLSLKWISPMLRTGREQQREGMAPLDERDPEGRLLASQRDQAVASLESLRFLADRQRHHAAECRKAIDAGVAQASALLMFETMRCYEAQTPMLHQARHRMWSISGGAETSAAHDGSRSARFEAWCAVLAEGKAGSAMEAARATRSKLNGGADLKLGSLLKSIRREYKRRGEPFPTFSRE